MSQLQFIVRIDSVELFITLDMCAVVAVPHLVGAQLCRLSPVDTHTFALKTVMEN